VRAYAIRRLLALVPTLLFASLIVRHTPGDVIDLMLSQNDISADKRSRVQLEAALGLDTPMPLQHVHQPAGRPNASRSA
jgi:peptide/nickel transport system permease protein